VNRACLPQLLSRPFLPIKLSGSAAELCWEALLVIASLSPLKQIGLKGESRAPSLLSTGGAFSCSQAHQRAGGGCLFGEEAGQSRRAPRDRPT
jgi:hypothetical protein